MYRSRDTGGQVERAGGTATHELTREEFEDASLGFLQMLRRRSMSTEFIRQNGEDLFAQAVFEYSRQVAAGVEIRDPGAWIVACGWNRTKSLLESRDWRPRFVSTECVAEPAAEESDRPEERFLEADRFRKVRKAVEELPLPQRRLIALSYFEGESVREAARRLHWHPAKAQRAHDAARKKLRRLLGDPESSDVLGLEIGLAAFLSATAAARGEVAEMPGGIEAAAERVWHGISKGVDRGFAFVRHPLGGGRAVDAGGASGGLSRAGERLLNSGAVETAAAGDGPFRAAEACKILSVCVIGGGAVTGALVATGHPHQRQAPTSPARTAKIVRATVRDESTGRGRAPTFGPAPRSTDVPVAAASSPRPRGGSRSAMATHAGAHVVEDARRLIPHAREAGRQEREPEAEAAASEPTREFDAFSRATEETESAPTPQARTIEPSSETAQSAKIGSSEGAPGGGGAPEGSTGSENSPGEVAHAKAQQEAVENEFQGGLR